jgi:hypothetical protein
MIITSMGEERAWDAAKQSPHEADEAGESRCYARGPLAESRCGS